MSLLSETFVTLSGYPLGYADGSDTSLRNFTSHIYTPLLTDQHYCGQPPSNCTTLENSHAPSSIKTNIAANNMPAQPSDNDIKWLEKAKEALWQYEIKSETIMQDVFDCIGILENDKDIPFDPPRIAKIAKELRRYVEFMDFVNEVLEDMVMDVEAVKRYRLLQEDRMLAQRTESACRL